jgi:hypothetical protein
MIRNWLCLALLATASAFAADRPDLTGTWKLDPEHSRISDEKLQSATLLIHQTADGLTIADNQVTPEGKEKKLQVDCNTMGKECKLKEGIFSLYYNGDVLVVMQTRGSNLAVKRRFTLSPDGSKLTVELVHISPTGKPAESYQYVKQ